MVLFNLISLALPLWLVPCLFVAGFIILIMTPGVIMAIRIVRKDFFDYEGTPSPLTETAPEKSEGGLSFCKSAILDK